MLEHRIECTGKKEEERNANLTAIYFNDGIGWRRLERNWKWTRFAHYRFTCNIL